MIRVNTTKTLDENASIRHLDPCENLDCTYEDLDWDVREAEFDVLVIAKEVAHTPIFENNMQRLKFFEKL